MATETQGHDSTAVTQARQLAASQSNTPPSKSGKWYQTAVKSLSPDTLDFFEKYLGLQGEEEVKAHIYRVRDMAWEIFPYPCIGRFGFLDFGIQQVPNYNDLVRRVRRGEVLLDIGCCLGQDLRRLAFDAGTSTNLVGSDVQPAFLQLGYELFADSGRFQGHFVPGDVFADDYLEQYRGKIDMIWAGFFLHLFDLSKQHEVVGQLQRLLAPRKGSVVVGRQVGADKSVVTNVEGTSRTIYRHDQQSISDLFGRVGQETGVVWSVTSSVKLHRSAHWEMDERMSGAQLMTFTATRQ